MANNNKKMFDDDSLDITDDLLYEFACTMDNDDINTHEKENEEQRLSQKLSQLSTSADDQNKQSKDLTMKRPALTTAEVTSTIPKKMKINNENVYNEEKEKDEIPNYLSVNYQPFQQLIQSILSTTANSMSTADLQKIVLLARQIAMIDLQKMLWTTYLRSGTGELSREYKLSGMYSEHDLYVWPMEMKSIMIKEMQQKKHDQQTNNNKEMTTINIDQIDNDTCLNYVYRVLHQFIQRKEQYDKELEDKIYSFRNFFTIEIEHSISQFIEQQEMTFIRKQYESKIAIVKFDYLDRLLQLEFHQLKPNLYQSLLFENIVQIKQEKEKSKYEVEMLKKRLLHRYLPEPINSLKLPLVLSSSSSESSLDTIHDVKIRQNLSDRYKKMTEQTKSDMMTLYISIAEAKMHEYQLKFNQATVQMKPDHSLTTPDKRLNQSMINIIEQCFKNIDERLEYLYNLKLSFLEEQTKKKYMQ